MTAPLMDAAPSRDRRRPWAPVAIALSGIIAVFSAPAVLGLLRETLRFNCSWNIGGEWGPDGSWACADGIGYLGAAVAVGGMSAVILLAGFGVWLAPPLFPRSAAYLGLAGFSLVWISVCTFAAATAYTGPRPAGEGGAALWAATALPGLALSAIGLLVGAAGALTSNRWLRAALWVGVGVMVVATILQLGLSVATIVSTGMLTAAGASHIRTRGRVSRRVISSACGSRGTR